MTTTEPSPLVGIYDALRAFDASWGVEITTPSGPGWIAGADLRAATRGPFNEILERIAVRAETPDRRTVAASFALRCGWASAMAIAPYLRYRCVPDISLENVSFKFRESTFLERTAIYEPRAIMIAGDPRAGHPLIATVADEGALLRALRAALVAQGTPVVRALHEWSGFSRRGIWGMLTSSWASQFTALCENRDDQRSVEPLLAGLFGGDDIVAEMQPRMRAVTYLNAIHLYQRRASCCRYYLLPKGDLCASCPLVSDDERWKRNVDWMKSQAEREPQRHGHA